MRLLLYWFDRAFSRDCWRPAGTQEWTSHDTSIQVTQPGFYAEGRDIEYQHQPFRRRHFPREVWVAQPTEDSDAAQAT